MFGDLLEDSRTAATVCAVLRAGGADAACRPVVWEGFVVDDQRGEEGGMDGIEEIEQIAVIAPRRIGRHDFRGIDYAACGEFAEGDERFPEMSVFWADPCGAEDVLKRVVDSEMLLAEHKGEIKLLCVRGLFRTVMAVDVVVERLERTFADAAAVQLNTDAFSVLLRPLSGLSDVFQIAVVFARKIEFVEDVRHGFETDCAVGAHINGSADFDGWKISSDNRCDER